MDLRAVACLCLLIALSFCAPTDLATQRTSEETQRYKEALKDIQEQIKSALDNLTSFVPNNSSVSLNKTEVLTIQDYISCLIDLSNKLPMLGGSLMPIVQAISDFATLTTDLPNCSLPLSKNASENAEETKILLEHLQKRLEKTKF